MSLSEEDMAEIREEVAKRNEVNEEKRRGLYQKYIVRRTDGKPVGEGVFLQFNDPQARQAIKVWAETMHYKGFYELHDDVMAKLKEYEQGSVCSSVGIVLLHTVCVRAVVERLCMTKVLGHYEEQLHQAVTILVTRKVGGSKFEDAIYKSPSAAAQQIERIMADPNVKALILTKIIVPQTVWVDDRKEKDEQ